MNFLPFLFFVITQHFHLSAANVSSKCERGARFVYNFLQESLGTILYGNGEQSRVPQIFDAIARSIICTG